MIIGINASYLTAKDKTGVENYASLLILALLQNDQNNHYRLFSPKYIDKRLLPVTGNYSLHISPFPRGWHRFRLPLSLLRHKVDLFFDPGYTVPPFVSVKSVITIHDLAFKYFPEAYSSAQLKTLERAFLLSQNKAAGLIFPSFNTQDDYKKFYPATQALTDVIPLGYDSRNFAEVNKKDILHLSVPYILFVGRLEKRKNLVQLVRAYTQLRHSHPELKHKLVLAGKPGYGFEDIAAEIASSKKFGKDIIVTGYMPDKDLPGLYSHADLFVYPSLYEGFGIPILEAFSSNTPVAAARCSSIPEIAGDAAYYFDPHDTSDMSKTLAQALCAQPQQKKKMIAKAKELLKKYTWDNYVDEFLVFIEKVCHESSNRS